MILEMKVPSPGESITEVEIADWLVQDGDYVEKDQAIAEVDSDKATLELPAEASGTITLQAEVGDAMCCRRSGLFDRYRSRATRGRCCPSLRLRKRKSLQPQKRRLRIMLLEPHLPLPKKSLTKKESI